MADSGLNNTGGRVLIGNYVEERIAAETLGATTNFNKDACASLELRGGNVGAISPGGKMDLMSTSRAGYNGAGHESQLAASERHTELLSLYTRANTQTGGTGPL